MCWLNGIEHPRDEWATKEELSLDVGLHVGRRHQLHAVPQCLQLARPMVRRCAGLDPDEAGRQRCKELQHMRSTQLPTNYNMPRGIDAVNLKYRLRDIHPIVAFSAMIRSLR